MGETSAAVLGPSVIFEGTFGQFWGNCRSVLGDLVASFERRNFEKKSQVISRLCLKRSISNFGNIMQVKEGSPRGLSYV